MRLLVLGGTDFVGRAVMDDALSRGWEVTTLNRGRTPTPEGVHALRGDRMTPEGLDPVTTGVQERDTVVDTWSWAPSAVRDAAAAPSERAEHYVYISSRSVHRAPQRSDRPRVGLDPAIEQRILRG